MSSTDPRYYDFDAAFAERQPIPFRLLGREWELPATCDAGVILRTQRLMLMVAKMEADPDAEELPEDFVVDDDLSFEKMCRDMVGDETVDAWLAYEWTDTSGRARVGIPYDMLMAVTQRLYALYSGTDPDQAPAPKAKPGKRPQDRKRKASARRK
ncbi:MAG TPA: hypothetical protein VFV01_47755 [Spirillospora sp.]|nr:hypothetical protein [Spirillospora sp.]